MHETNLDFGIPVTQEQWEQLSRTAQRLGPGQAGFAWNENEPQRIRVLLRDEDVTGIWRDQVTAEELYGESEQEVAEFVFNDERPYARVRPPSAPRPPVVTEAQEQAMQEQLEHWVREKWHQLMRESGLHYDRGHVPQS